jgi:RES domain
VNPNRASWRFNRAGTGPTQYLCLHPLGPWAEYLRAENRRTVADLLDLRTRMWVLRVRVAELLDVSFESAAGLGLKAEDLVADDYGPCQELGERCRADPAMPKCLRVPSAALPGSYNLVIFGPRVAMPFSATPIDDVDVPCAAIADDARCVTSPLPAVRFEGQPHPGLDAWKAGRRFELREPVGP